MVTVQGFGCMLGPFKQRGDGGKMSHLKKFFFIKINRPMKIQFHNSIGKINTKESIFF